MPCLEVTMPQTDDQTKATLSRRLTDAFVDATGLPADIFGIRYCEYAANEATGGGGELWNGDDGRPYLHVILYGHRMRREAKQAIVAGFTNALVESVNRPKWWPVIHICEHAYDNVGVEGKLLSDTYPELRDRPFYYALED